MCAGMAENHEAVWDFSDLLTLQSWVEYRGSGQVKPLNVATGAFLVEELTTATRQGRTYFK